jgi:dynein heavy chain
MINEYKTKPDDGAYIFGLSMEGARWDYERHIVTHSNPKELFTTFPLILIVP